MRPNALILPIILAGGEGRRLAPITSPARPKPFVPLPDGESLLTKTCARLSDPSRFMPPVIVGQEAHRFALLNHARDAGTAPQAILLEPRPYNTAMAVAVAVAWARQAYPEVALAILPADHAIEPVSVWAEAVIEAAGAAREANSIGLLAVEPQRARPDYGYMALTAQGSHYRVERFVEKPTQPEVLLAENREKARWFWNSGQFIAPVAVFAAALEMHAATLWEAARRAVMHAHRAWEFTLLEPSAYIDIESLPFDRVVLEKTTSIAVPIKAAWHDLGLVSDWESYTKTPVTDCAGTPVRVDRPWGHFSILSQTSSVAEKRLTIYPRCRISLQRHWLRSEAWEVLDGVAHVELEHRRIILQPGDKIVIPPACWHRLSNICDNTLYIKEIQSGFPDENDIERMLDDYGRT